MRGQNFSRLINFHFSPRTRSRQVQARCIYPGLPRREKQVPRTAQRGSGSSVGGSIRCMPPTPFNSSYLILTPMEEFGVTRVDKESADQLVNRTSEIPNDPGYYITALDVFHQMHCLNNLRKAVWPEYYGIWDGLTQAQKAEEQDHLSKFISIPFSLLCPYVPLNNAFYPSRSLRGHPPSGHHVLFRHQHPLLGVDPFSAGDVCQREDHARVSGFRHD